MSMAQSMLQIKDKGIGYNRFMAGAHLWDMSKSKTNPPKRSWVLLYLFICDMHVVISVDMNTDFSLHLMKDAGVHALCEGGLLLAVGTFHTVQWQGNDIRYMKQTTMMIYEMQLTVWWYS